jgi:hypothetical protein
MPFTWEVKSSWVGVVSTYPGRVIYIDGDDFTSIGGKWVRQKNPAGESSRFF